MNKTTVRNFSTRARAGIDRRAFVKTAALAGAGLAAGPAIARAAKIPAKDRAAKRAAQNAAAQAAAPDATPVAGFDATGKPNVLMICIDDLRTWVNCLGYSQAKTPNIDRLFAMGVTLTRAYCPAPVCNPSRTALLTGLRPSTTGVYNNGDDWRVNKIIGDAPTLPLWLTRHGYNTFGAGKIYHDNYRRESDWTEYPKYETQKALPSPESRAGVLDIKFRPLIAKDSDMVDHHTVDYCIDVLNRKHDKPFLIGCGLHKPHMPWEVPQKYFDMYPLDKLELPKVQPNLDALPASGKRMALAGGQHEAMLKTGRWKEAVQAYLACITFLDAQIGRLLDAFDKCAHKDNTIILFWVDHGWHLGEQQHWRKFCLWENAARVPVMWRVPGMTKPGARCERTLDHTGIFPTLCDLLGLPLPPQQLEGASYRALLENPGAAWNRPALTTFMQNNHSVRTEKWRYIRYKDGGEELYDHDTDPLEWNNLAGDPRHDALKKDLAKWFPKVNVTMQSAGAKKAKNAGKGANAAAGDSDE